MPRKTSLLAIVALVTVAVAAGPAGAAPVATLPGFNNVRPVLEENGFSPFQATYVRCYTDAQWSNVTHGATSIMGFYQRGSWINTRIATCINATKLLNAGQLNYTNVAALTTLLDETVQRQGVTDEPTAECLADWLTGHAVERLTGSLAKGKEALGLARLFAQQRLLPKYRTSATQCAQLAVEYGVQPLQNASSSGSTAAAAPATPPPYVAPATPPVQVAPAAKPAPPSVVFDQTYVLTDTGAAPFFNIGAASRVDLTYSVGPGAGGTWAASCSVYDAFVSADQHDLSAIDMAPGDTRTVSADGLTGHQLSVYCPASAIPGSHVENLDLGNGLTVPMTVQDPPGPLSIHVVAYH
jgi:hypothetical protein